jgi:hypothetical protein
VNTRAAGEARGPTCPSNAHPPAAGIPMITIATHLLTSDGTVLHSEG